VPFKPSPQFSGQRRGDEIIPTARFHVTFKAIKRQMYDRAKLDLLRELVIFS
jgi:hypothetical protein